MSTEKEREMVAALVERTFDEEDDAAREALADEILSIDPGNAVAKFIKWENLSEEESLENLDILEDAFETLRAEAEKLQNASEDEQETYQTLMLSMLSNLASCEYFKGDREKALEFAEEYMNLDDGGNGIGRIIYYTLLIELEKYDEAIEAADTDLCETPMSEHARAIALFETQGPGQDASDALLQAICLDPDMVFFILGLGEWEGETPDEYEEFEETDDQAMQIAMLSDLWLEKEERLAFLGTIAFAFGYLSGRFEGTEDITMLEDGYKSLGCLDDMISAKQAVASMIADNRESEEVDEEALTLLRELIDRGVFS